VLASWAISFSDFTSSLLSITSLFVWDVLTEAFYDPVSPLIQPSTLMGDYFPEHTD
jgi:hypothetical protein